MNPARAFTTALGLFQEQKPVIGVPFLAAAPAPQPTKTDLDQGVGERRNSHYNRLQCHLKSISKFELTHTTHTK